MIKFGIFWFYRRKYSNLHYFVINSPWQRVGPFIWINFTQGCFVLSIVEIGRQVLERKIFKLVNVFSLFHYYLPLEKGMALYLNKHELPSPKDTLCQVWMKLAHFFWRRRFFRIGQYIFTIHNYLPMEKSRVLHLNKPELASPKDTLCQVWLKFAKQFWRRFFKFCQCIFAIL